MKEIALAYLADGKSFYEVANILSITPQDVIKIYAEFRASK